jgi:hypothetical protein
MLVGHIACRVERIDSLEQFERLEQLIYEEAERLGVIVHFTSDVKNISEAREDLADIGLVIAARKEKITRDTWRNCEKPARHCVHCSKAIPYTNETPAQWSAIRHCAACKQVSSTNLTTKYCRICRKPRSLDEHRQLCPPYMSQSSSFLISWSAWNQCEYCKLPPLDLSKLIEDAMANDPELRRLITLRDELLRQKMG